MQEQDEAASGMDEIERVRRQVEEVRERIRAVTASQGRPSFDDAENTNAA